MPLAAQQLAPFVTLRPRTTPALYSLLVRIRRAVLAHSITDVIPELDGLIEQTIDLAHASRCLAVGPDIASDAALEQAADLAPLLQHIDARLSQHAEHPGVAALHARIFPHGLPHLLALPVRSLALELEALLTTLLLPVYLPYVETAGLLTVSRELLAASHALAATLAADRGPGLHAIEQKRIAVHHELGLLWVRLFAACWSDTPAHAHCRAHLLSIWSHAESPRTPPNTVPPAHDSAVLLPTSASEQVCGPPPIRVRIQPKPSRAG